MVTVSELQQRYPNPISSDGVGDPEKPGQYCVGGSLCLHLVGGPAFPRYGHLAAALTTANPMLAQYEVTLGRLVSDVISLNDDERFDEAWAVLGTALTWTPGPTTEVPRAAHLNR